MIKTVSIIGSGRVATHFANVLKQHVHIRQIYSRTFVHAQALANQVQAQAIDELSQLMPVDLVMIAVSDNEIKSVAEQLSALNYEGLVVHTSGSTHIDVLKEASLNAGVFYPLQTFSFEHAVDWKNTPLFIEAKEQSEEKVLIDLAKNISDRVYQYNSEQRLSLHLAAVFACNFTNHCYDVAQQILDQKQVDFQLLMPLIQATTQKLTQTSAYQNQTGPARRQDHKILDMHHAMLEEQPHWQAIYDLLSTQILKRFDQKD